MNIIRGKLKCAKKIVVYGPEGIGKSSFAAQFPDPIFIDTEGSTKDMDVARFENASSWTMLLEQVRYVWKNPNCCKTLIIDTIDWAEQMCVADLCAKNGKKGIEDFGYGNGYVYSKEEFGRFLNTLNEVVDAGINAVLTAHAQIRKFEQPDEMGSYDRWELKLGKKTASQTAPLIKEWADMVLFANYKTMVYNVDGQGAGKGKNKAQGGKRVMYTSHHPCWDAKNRYGLPDEMEFCYDLIAHIIIEGKDNLTQTQAIKEKEVKTEPKTPTVQKVEKAEKVNEEKQEVIKHEEPLLTEEIEKKPDNKPDNRESNIPKPLLDLMKEHKVDEWDIQEVVAARGYYPTDTPIENYDPDFISGVLIAAWEQVYAMIKDLKEKEELPFN